MCGAARWYLEAESSAQQSPRHIWKGKEEQCTAPKRVNCAYRWPSESGDRKLPSGCASRIGGNLRKIYQSEPPREKKCGTFTRIRICEESGRVECHDINFDELACTWRVLWRKRTCFHKTAVPSSPRMQPVSRASHEQ